MIKAIFFDWGNVLIENPFQAIVMTLANEISIDKRIFKQHFMAYFSSMELGEIDPDKIMKLLCEKLKVDNCVAPHKYYNLFKKNYKPIPEMFELARNLSKKYKVAILSNTEKNSIEFLKNEVADQYSMFLDLIFSCEIALRKPHPEIYEYALNKLNISPSEAVFIDDLQENIAGCVKVGINGILFQNPSQVKKELKKLKVITSHNSYFV